MRRLLLGLTATAALVGGTTVLATPADAAIGDNRCITRAEFRAVTKGTTITRAHNVIDYRGSQTWYSSGYPGEYGWPAEQSREYRQCGSKYGSASVDYQKQDGVWRVSSKYAYWW
jgi:hypothetical protein